MLAQSPPEVFTACLARDLPILRLAVDGLRRHLGVETVQVATARKNFHAFRAALGEAVHLHDEDELVPTMTLADLRRMELPFFPQGAGWYFQQLLKYAYAFRGKPDAPYLIWDADTVLLRPLALFDAAGRTWFTMADEFHAPYFETYQRLLGHEAKREFSFISQHITVSKPVLREMLAAIERHCPGEENWAWKIMRNLADRGNNRFSEYETYGHYVKNVRPEMAAFRHVLWTRDGTRLAGYPPSARSLARLAQNYDFAAFEISQTPLRRAVSRIRGWLPGR